MYRANSAAIKRTRPAIALALLAMLLLAGCFQPVDRIDFANMGVERTIEPSTPTPTPITIPTAVPTPTPTQTPLPEPTETPIPTPLPEVDLFVDILEPPDNITVLGRNLTVRGITNIKNTITINGSRVIVNDAGEFTTEVSLSLGANVIEVLATNISGEQLREFATVSYIRPSPPPFFLLVTEPTDQVIVANQFIRVTGKTVPQATITVKGVGVAVDEAGNFSTLVRLSVGVNLIEVLARNSDGRRLNAKLSVDYSP